MDMMRRARMAAARGRGDGRGAGRSRGQGSAEQATGGPTLKIDATWPQEFPNHWILGSITGVFVDARDHVWIAHLPETLTEEELYEEQTPPMGTCCKAAPVIIELDQNGKVVQGWGDKAKDEPANWPRNPHGIFVDHTDHVWVGSHMHHRVMKFTREGKLVLTVGAVRQERRQRRHDAARRPVGHLGRSEDQRGVHLRRLPQPPRDRRRRRDRRLQTALGRLRTATG